MKYPEGFDEYRDLIRCYTYFLPTYRQMQDQKRQRETQIKEFELKNPDYKYLLCRYYLDNPPRYLTVNGISTWATGNLTVSTPGMNTVIKNYGG